MKFQGSGKDTTSSTTATANTTANTIATTKAAASVSYNLSSSSTPPTSYNTFKDKGLLLGAARSPQFNFFSPGSTRNLIIGSSDRMLEARKGSDSIMSIERRKQDSISEKRRQTKSFVKSESSDTGNSTSIGNFEGISEDARDRRPSVS